MQVSTVPVIALRVGRSGPITTADMLFVISTDRTSRAILDDDAHGDVVAVIEADTWQEAREHALEQTGMNAYFYFAGYGWFTREGFKKPPLPMDNK